MLRTWRLFALAFRRRWRLVHHRNVMNGLALASSSDIWLQHLGTCEIHPQTEECALLIHDVGHALLIGAACSLALVSVNHIAWLAATSLESVMSAASSVSSLMLGGAEVGVVAEAGGIAAGATAGTLAISAAVAAPALAATGATAAAAVVGTAALTMAGTAAMGIVGGIVAMWMAILTAICSAFAECLASIFAAFLCTFLVVVLATVGIVAAGTAFDSKLQSPLPRPASPPPSPPPSPPAKLPATLARDLKQESAVFMKQESAVPRPRLYPDPTLIKVEAADEALPVGIPVAHECTG